MSSDVKILDQVRKLVELQQVDALIYECKKELVEKPSLLAEIKSKFEAKKVKLNESEDHYKKIQVTHKTLEGDLQVKDEAIAKANVQLSQIKTNKEYTAKLTEIENIKADKSILEEKILLSYDETDAAKAAIEKEKAHLAEEEKKYLSEKKEVDDLVAQIKEKVKGLENQRQHIVPEVDKELLARYERILENREGLAIVPVSGTSCGGCFMNVPAQVINEIKMHNKMIICEMCARILYIQEDI